MLPMIKCIVHSKSFKLLLPVSRHRPYFDCFLVPSSLVSCGFPCESVFESLDWQSESIYWLILNILVDEIMYDENA